MQILVNRMGTTQTYVSPPGSGVALVKFRDVPLERVLTRMQQELGPLGSFCKVTIFSEKQLSVTIFLLQV